MEIVATPAAVRLIRARGGRLYVWPRRTVGCQGLTLLESAFAPPRGRRFARAGFEAFELWLADGAAWPRELLLEARRGRVAARWDGRAWV